MSLIGDLSNLAHEILTNTDDFATPAVLISPAGIFYEVTIVGADIGLTFDLETQQQVAGRRVTCAISSRQLSELEIDPRGVGENDRHPWVLNWTPPTGPALKLKVAEVLPDKLGVTVFHLETYRRETR